MIHLQENKVDWFQALMNNAHAELPEWNVALYDAQRTIASSHVAFLDISYQIKVNCFVRFIHLPAADTVYSFPNHDQLQLFREVKGVVVRVTDTKLLEVKRSFVCTLCQAVVTVNAEYGLNFKFEVPKSCNKVKCKGTMRPEDSRPPAEYCVQYQEIKIQVKHINKFESFDDFKNVSFIHYIM